MKDGRREVRVKACELAAQVMAGVVHGRPDAPLVPRLWSLAVFFECYIEGGSAGTRKEFGPRKPVKIKVVR